MNRIPDIPDPDINGHHRLLAIAALIEGDFSIDWLVELSQMKASKILMALHERVDQHDLVVRQPGVFCFLNSEKRETWQTHLTEEEKKQLHWRIAELLLKEPLDDATKALAIAPHLLQFPNDEQQCRWLIMAGNAHRRFFRIEEALQCFTKAIETLWDLQGEEVGSLFIKAAIAYSKMTTGKHHTKKIRDVLDEALSRSIKWGMKGEQALLKMHMAKNEWLGSRFQNAMRFFEQGWSMAKEIDDAQLARSANTFGAFFLFWQGRFKEAVSFYEKTVSDVEKYPEGRFPLLATIIIGRCYAHIGQTSQAFGMLDGIHTHCLERGDLVLASHASGSLGATLLEVGRLQDAIEKLQCAIEEANQGKNEWVKLWATQVLAFAYHLQNDHEQSLGHLQKFLQYSRSIDVTIRFYPYLMQLAWAVKQGSFPPVQGLSCYSEISYMFRSQNIYLRGVAYRYKGLLLRGKKSPSDKIIQYFQSSVTDLEESGDQIELIQSNLELAREYLFRGEEEKARERVMMASRILPSFNRSTIPEELRALIRPITENRKDALLKEILNLGHEVVAIRDGKELAQQIISAVNQITGAERGAIFLLDQESSQLRLRASKNLTSDQVSHPSFSSSLKMIEECALQHKGFIRGMVPKDDQGSPREIIRSCICVPMIFRDQVTGVLYHDNCLFSSLFQESDLELLAYFAAQAAIALENARAYEEINRLNEKLQGEKLYYKERHLLNLYFEDIVGESPAIMEVLDKVEQVAHTESTVLILGETGVGKELIATAIHNRSRRREKPFIRVFCNALPESLIPSELFGHEKGSFTGANQRRLGKFELADEGTLFLDEVGDLHLDVQVRLLRILQNKEFERVGGNETLHSDFRLVAATNRDLNEFVHAGRFRSDLFYRINVFPIYIPPLRERVDDIPLLAQHFLIIYAAKTGKIFEGIAQSQVNKLLAYDWPGNIRELENIIERGTILSKNSYFRVPDLGAEKHTTAQPQENESLSSIERQHILSVLAKTGWKVRSRGGAAELLNINPSTLAFRMKKLGIRRPTEFSRKRRDLKEGRLS